MLESVYTYLQAHYKDLIIILLLIGSLCDRKRISDLKAKLEGPRPVHWSAREW